MKRSTLYLLPAVLLLVVGAVLGMQLESYISSNDTVEQLKKLEDAFIVINKRYVEDVDAGVLAADAIEGMLEHLDPHSTYISAEEIAEVQESYQGSFGGIGIYFESIGDTSRVISTIPGGPSEEAGLMAGDRIIGVEDTTAIGFDSRDIQKYLKGPIGTEVDVLIKRPGVQKPLPFTITRDRIPLYSIDSSYMVDDATGYIKISRFAMTTAEEFSEALNTLQEQGAQRLVIDLRNNPGGIMQAAVLIADELLPGGLEIVSTRGRDPQLNEVHRSTSRGQFESKPVIVLVNENAASASEILAGALQDHDRGLIVGRRTFGKGLVQNQFALSDGSVLQMTTARYYTPTGRLIQTPYEGADLENYYEQKFETLEQATFNPADYVDSIPDSLKYETDRGRLVFGGGGILPDYVVQPDSTSSLNTPVVRAIWSNSLGLLFVRQYLDSPEGQALRADWESREEAFLSSFTVTDELWGAFWTFAASKDDDRRLTLTTDAAEANPQDGVFTHAEAQASRETLSILLKARLAQRLYESAAWYPVIHQIDHEFNEAMALWDRAQALAAYYDGTDTAASGNGR